MKMIKAWSPMGACAIAALVSAAAVAQTAASSGKFDGRWEGQSIKCFPNQGQYRFTSLTVKNDTFSIKFTFDGVPANCSVRISPDGSFENKECSLQTTGQIKGEMMDLKIRAANNFCDIAAKLKKT